MRDSDEPRERDAASTSEGFIGQSRAARELRRALAVVAPADSGVLLRGETGTGKGLLASLIHTGSRRAARPFVHVDCTALSSSLVESELFGHERGAFTGANERRSGRFELAAHGTIFLDEIGDLDPALQAKLLRVLHDRRFERIGGTRTLEMSARVLAATNRDLESAIRAGTFRKDLYYRLNILEIWIPPLRERREDIAPLTRHCVERWRKNGHEPSPRVDESFYAALEAHPWPGNARELQNFVQRAMVLSSGHCLDARAARALLDRGPSQAGGRPFDADSVSEGPGVSDRSEIIEALRASQGNVSRAAAVLRVPRSTLRYRIARLGLAKNH